VLLPTLGRKDKRLQCDANNMVKDLLTNEKSVYLGLIDLLFAYSYNHRQTEGESNVESVWTIGKLSPTIAGLEVAP
jgi:hypothetical protein